MAIKDSILPEFDHEMGATRRLLERVPDGDLKWTPHDKSFNMGRLAGHIANIPRWAIITCETDLFDPSAIGDEGRPKDPVSMADVVKQFDANVAEARKKISEQTDASLMSPWTLKQDGQEVLTLPKVAVLRSYVLNHLIHHRGQLTVYLRLRNVPLPSIYGPTADEG
jgi:uncharacterized damage-inducible protein DinB